MAALTSNGVDTIGQTNRDIALSAAQAVTDIRPNLMIDSSLQAEGSDGSLRSPWDSPNAHRRYSDYPYPPTLLGGDSPRSPYFAHRAYPTGQLVGVHPTSLTRMVHDAALRTGHAQDHAAVLNPSGPSSVPESERGSHDSPVGADSGEGSDPSPQEVTTPLSGTNGVRRPPSAFPLGAASELQNSKIKRRHFSVPPLPPQPAVERLVAAYVDFVGVTAPIIHIPSLGKQLIKIRGGRDVEQSDIFVVMMVLGQSNLYIYASS